MDPLFKIGDIVKPTAESRDQFTSKSIGSDGCEIIQIHDVREQNIWKQHVYRIRDVNTNFAVLWYESDLEYYTRIEDILT